MRNIFRKWDSKIDLHAGRMKKCARVVQNLNLFGVKIGPKFVKNPPKIEKNTDSETNFEFDTIFWSVFDEILVNSEAKMRPNFDQILR